MAKTFRDFIDRVLSSEGGFSLDRTDPGNWTSGRPGQGKLAGTKYGISAMSYPHLNIKDLTRDQAIAIYERDFWKVVGADKFPPALGYQMLDAAINSGPGKAIMWLQKAAGVADDGKFGAISRAAVEKADPADLLLLVVAYRLDFMTRLNNWPSASRGWARRIAANLCYAASDN